MYPNVMYYQHPWHHPMQWAGNHHWGYAGYPVCSWIHHSPTPYGGITLQDYGARPFVVNIEQAAKLNNNFRTALWTGKHFQVTLMSIPVGEDIGLETHPTTDQFIRIEEGQALVQMGDRQDQFDFQVTAQEDDAIMIPAGKWHNVTNTGSCPLKVYVIYAPPEHPFGTVHATKAIAQQAEK